MVELRINGKAVVLRPGTEASLELPGFAADFAIEDGFSLPFEIPVSGNEALLNHIEQLARTQRELRMGPAELLYNGVPRHWGWLYFEQVVASNDPGATVAVSFTEDGLVRGLSELNMQEVDYGPTIYVTDTADDLPDYARDANADPDNYPMCFPSFYNPDVYGGKNKAFDPSTSEWNSTQSYAVDDLVTVEAGNSIRRTRTFQCLVAHTNQNPITAGSYWREVRFGVVNRWSGGILGGDFLVNDASTGNVYAMCPWFYLKWIVAKLFAHLGYQAAGDFMDDPAVSRLCLANNSLLDSASLEAFFAAQQTTPTTINSSVATLACNDDTTPPYTDPDLLWNPASFRFTCDAAGARVFRVRVVAEFDVDTSLILKFVRASTDTVLSQTSNGLPGIYNQRKKWDYTISITYTFGGGDVGQDFYIQVSGEYNVPSQVSINYAVLSSWRYGASNYINTYSTRIHPERHMPDMNAGDFISEFFAAFNIQHLVEKNSNRILLNYRNQRIQRTAAQPDLTHRLLGPVRIENVQNAPSVVLRYDVDDLGDQPDLTGMDFVGSHDREEAVFPPSAPGQWTYIANTRRLLVSRVANTSVFWYPVGYHLPDREVPGEGEGRIELTLKMAPVMMEWLTMDGEAYVLPWISGQGSSPYYGTEGRMNSLRIALFAGLHPGYSGGQAPLATPWGLTAFSDDSGTLNLDLTAETGGYEAFWARWVQEIGRSEVCVADLELRADDDIDDLRTSSLLLHNQRMWVERLPITYPAQGERILSIGARLRRVLPSS